MYPRRLLSAANLSIAMFTLILLLGASCTRGTPNPHPPGPAPTLPPGKTRIVLYFADQAAISLVPEERLVDAAEGAKLAEAVVRELIKGPASVGLEITIPPEARLIGVKLEGDMAVVNFSREFRTKHWGGSTGELMTVMSLADSLTELPGVKRIKIQVEGEQLETLGHLDLTEPIGRNEKIIAVR